MIRTAVFCFCTLLLFISPALADVTSKPCPYSCKSIGIKKQKNCRDWKKGNTCFVEDLRKNKKTKAKKGVTSQACPYSCKSIGLGKKKCKDWKEGNTCFVKVL